KGQATILANSAQLSSDFQNGILRSARMVLAEKVQIAAQQINRIDGNYTLMTNSVTSSCRVCANHPTPLWEIRARKIIHDQKGQRLYFDQAQVRVAGVPVLYLPRLRLPDPTVKRMSGFLTPRVTGSSKLGTGVTVPYFQTLGPSRDVVIAPYIGTKDAFTLGLQYREAFNTGSLAFEGALSKDDIYPDKTRGYLLLHGDFELPRDFKLHFQLQSVSDPDYFNDYGLNQIDRLKSGVEVSRTRRDEYI
ncbi:LPS-assembly protein LptD, partial [Thioclava sp. BHET1]